MSGRPTKAMSATDLDTIERVQREYEQRQRSLAEVQASYEHKVATQ